MKKYLILFVIILIQGCSSGGGDSAPVSTEEVNLLETWNYTLTSTDECAGFVAIGIVDFQSLNGDITTLGNLLLQGEGFDSINGVCSLVPIDITDTDWIGRPAVQTANEFQTFYNLDAASSGEEALKVNVFTSNQIVLLSGPLTFTWTR